MVALLGYARCSREFRTRYPSASGNGCPDRACRPDHAYIGWRRQRCADGWWGLQQCFSFKLAPLINIACDPRRMLSVAANLANVFINAILSQPERGYLDRPQRYSNGLEPRVHVELIDDQTGKKECHRSFSLRGVDNSISITRAVNCVNAGLPGQPPLPTNTTRFPVRS